MSIEKLGVLASGRGSNFQAILEHLELGILKAADVSVLITDNPDAQALEISDRFDVPHQIVNPQVKENKKEFEHEIHKIFDKHNVSLVIMAGFMRILSPFFLDKYEEKIMNIHPALLPSFKGLNAQEQALEYGVKVSGCTIHYASEEVDSGPIILQHPVPVRENDSVRSLADRILVFEHRMYSKAIQLHVDDRLEVIDGRVKIDYGDGWKEEWDEREKTFIEHQKKSWEKDEVFRGVWK